MSDRAVQLSISSLSSQITFHWRGDTLKTTTCNLVLRMEHVRGFWSEKRLGKYEVCSATKHVQAYLGDTVGSVPDHHNKANITKRVTRSFWFPSTHTNYVDSIL